MCMAVLLREKSKLMWLFIVPCSAMSVDKSFISAAPKQDFQLQSSAKRLLKSTLYARPTSNI